MIPASFAFTKILIRYGAKIKITSDTARQKETDIITAFFIPSLTRPGFWEPWFCEIKMENAFPNS